MQLSQLEDTIKLEILIEAMKEFTKYVPKSKKIIEYDIIYDKNSPLLINKKNNNEKDIIRLIDRIEKQEIKFIIYYYDEENTNKIDLISLYDSLFETAFNRVKSRYEIGIDNYDLKITMNTLCSFIDVINQNFSIFKSNKKHKQLIHCIDQYIKSI